MKNLSYEERARNHQITTILIHRVKDKAIIDWLKAQPNNSEAIRRAIHREIEAERGHPAIDPETIRGVIEDSLAGALGQLRQIIEAAVDSALDGRTIGAGGRPAPMDTSEEIEALLAGLDLALEVE